MKSTVFFIFALIVSLVLYMTISQSGIINPYTQSEPMVENPFLNVIKQVEEENEIDLDFYKKVKKTMNYEIVDMPIINNFSAPYDVLVVGDSSMLMGVSSNVVNQVAGKNVGFFSFPAMKLNMELLHFISFFRETYMTKDPQIILAFDPKFLLVDADDIQEHEGLGSLIREPERRFRPTSFCLFCTSVDELHQRAVKKKIKDMFNFIYFRPPAIRFYHFLIEEFVSIRAYKQHKIDNKDSNRGARFVAQDGSILIHKTNPRKVVKLHDPELMQLDLEVINWMSAEITRLSLDPIFWVPLTSDKQIRVRLLSIYNQKFSEYEILDANKMMKQGEVVDAQNRTHLANLGPIKQSMLMGNWIKAN